MANGRLLALAFALSVGCNRAEPAVEAEPEPTPTPAPTVEPPPPPPPPAPPPGCRLVIEADAEDNDAAIARAMVNTKTGGLYDTQVIDGREIMFVCPPAAEHKDADVIAERSDKEIVHWSGVDLEQTQAGREPLKLQHAASKPDLPASWSEADRARLQAKWPELSRWTEQPTAKRPTTPVQPATPVQQREVPVVFSAHELHWAEILIEERSSKRVTRMVLDPTHERQLAPGDYTISYRLVDGDPWQELGTLVVSADKPSYDVALLDKPPRFRVR